MVTPEQLSAKCPALAWAQHRFSTEVPLPSGRKLVHRFDIPRTEDERLAIKMTADKLIECYHDILGDITNRHEALDALADLLNARMAIQAKAVALQVKLVGQCLKSIAFGQWVIAHLMLRSLEVQLSPHEGELWAYEWPEWIALVDQFIAEHADVDSLKVIQMLRNGREM